MAYENELAIAQKAVIAAAKLCETVRREMVPEAMEKSRQKSGYSSGLRFPGDHL